VPSAINQVGKGTLSLGVTYNGTQSLTSDQIVIRMYDGSGITITSETINMKAAWNP